MFLSCSESLWLWLELKSEGVQGDKYIRDPPVSPKLRNVGTSVIACWKALLNAKLWSNFQVIWLTHVRIARILKIKT